MEITKFRERRKDNIIDKIIFVVKQKKNNIQFNLKYGIHMDDIARVMKQCEYFVGVFHDNNLSKIEHIKPKHPIVAFIILYRGHFRAVYIDMIRDITLEYYDPFGKSPELIIRKLLIGLIHNLKCKYYLVFKINSVRNQRINSKNCGLHCLNFLLDRIYNNRTFKEATGFSILQSENRARRSGAVLRKFDYI
jgi:hypothetical protein